MAGKDLIRVAPESGPADFFEVRLASLPVPVRIEYSAIRDLRSGFDGNGERMGLLLGSSSPQAVSIKRCELLALSPATLANPKSLQGALHQFIRARSHTPLEDAPELLGCFRTQTTGWSGIREGDLEIAKRSFPELDPIFLLIRTTQHRPWLAALYALEANAASPSEPALEFPFDEYLLRNGYLTALVESPESAEPVEQPHPPQTSKTSWIMAAVLLVLVLGASAAAYKWYRPAERAEVVRRNVASAGSMGLKVNRSGSDFEVSWDRLSAAVLQSTTGMLTISDGALTRAVALSGAQLREGRILYTPLFEELTFRLEVATPDLGTATESVQVLAWSGKQSADVLTVAPPDPLTNGRARAVASGTASLPSRAPATNPAAPPPPIPQPQGLRTNSGTITPSPAAKSAPATSANVGIHPPPATASPVPQTVAVIQPSSPNSPPKQETAGTTPARTPVASPPAVAFERLPAIQPSPQAPANAPVVQPPASSAPKPVAPAPKPEAPPVSQPLPSVSAPALPPPTVAPAAAPGVSPAPVQVATASAGPPVLPVPIQRVTPALPHGVPTATTSGAPRAVSVRVMVNSAGSVQSSEVISSTPKGAFGEGLVKIAALDAAKQWKFRPGQVNGKNVAAEYIIEFRF